MNDTIKVWILSGDKYVQGTVSKSQYDSGIKMLNVVTSAGNSIIVARQEIIRANPEDLSISDLTSLPFLDEPNLLQALHDRYNQNQIYTYMANVLIAVNPYQTLSSSTGDTSKKTPHVCGIAQQALEQLYRVDRKSLKSQPQSIVCCGESGSGKTVSTKQIMQHLCSASNPNITMQILDANPILEAFGNAQTLRNHNSSRFAKFIKMYFSSSQTIISAFTETYLLERSRVVTPPTGERNFHILHALQREKTPSEKFTYLGGVSGDVKTTSGDVKTTLGDVKTTLSDLESRLEHFGFKKTDTENLWNLCLGILHLGNVTAQPGVAPHEQFVISPTGKIALDKAALSWKIEPLVLETYLCNRSLVVIKDVVQMKLSIHDTIINRDAMAKLLYLKIFQWLVDRVNRGVSIIDESRERWIGILDVFGFEVFPNNSFEQYCINLANEKLQNFFNQYILDSEQNEYLKEGIMWKPLVMPSNTVTLNLLEGKPSGIISLVDSVCMMPKGTSEILIDNIVSVHAKHPSLFVTKKTKNTFGVHHYAGDVVYDTTNFLSKNNDSQNPDFIQLFKSSKIDLLKQLFSDSSTVTPSSSRFVSVGRIFQHQLSSLLQTLQATTPYFVRCINPNPHQKPKTFNWQYIRPQIKCGGLLQAVEVLKYGYPFRVSYTQISEPVIKQLSSHVSYPLDSAVYARNICEGLMMFLVSQKSPEATSKYQLGITKIFFGSGQQHILENLLQYMKTPLPFNVIQHVHKWIKKRRWDRLRCGIRVYLHWKHELKRVQVMYVWRKAVRILQIINLTFGRVLKKIRKTVPRKWSIYSPSNRSGSPEMSAPDIIDMLETNVETSLETMHQETDKLKKEASALREQQLLLEQQSLKAAEEREKAFIEKEEHWKNILQQTTAEWKQKCEEKEQRVSQLAELETLRAAELKSITEQVDVKSKMLQEATLKQQSLEQMLLEREQNVKYHKDQIKMLKEKEIEVKGVFENQLNTTQQVFIQHNQTMQAKDKLIEQLKSHIKKLETDMQIQLGQYRQSLQQTYERRIKLLEKQIKRQQLQIYSLSKG